MTAQLFESDSSVSLVLDRPVECLDYSIHSDADDLLPTSEQHEDESNSAMANDAEETGVAQSRQPSIRPLIEVRKRQSRPRDFEILQQWEGVVNEVRGDCVFAELFDLNDNSAATEFVEIYLRDFPEADRTLLDPGSVFYWAIGYERDACGSILRVSQIRMRRSPVWRKRDIERAKAEADKLYEAMTGA